MVLEREKMKLTTLALGSVPAFLLLIALSGCTDRNSLKIRNCTKSGITVVSAKLDGKIISKKEIIVSPTPKNHYFFVPIYTSFRAVNPRYLELEIKYPTGIISTSCNLGEISQDGGCLFLVSYNGTNKLKCDCDPYADFEY